MNVMSTVTPADAGIVPTSKDVTKKVFDTHYGFVVRDGAESTMVSNVLRVVSICLAIAFAYPAIAMWISPTATLAADVLLFKVIASIGLMACGVVFGSFGLRPCPNEVQFDAIHREVREVKTCGAGRSRVVGRYGFDTLSGTFLVREEYGMATLVMRYKNTQKFIYVCKGDEYDLAVIKNRVGRQILTSADVVPLSKATRGARKMARVMELAKG